MRTFVIYYFDRNGHDAGCVLTQVLRRSQAVNSARLNMPRNAASYTIEEI